MPVHIRKVYDSKPDSWRTRKVKFKIWAKQKARAVGEKVSVVAHNSKNAAKNAYAAGKSKYDEHKAKEAAKEKARKKRRLAYRKAHPKRKHKRR